MFRTSVCTLSYTFSHRHQVLTRLRHLPHKCRITSSPDYPNKINTLQMLLDPQLNTRTFLVIYLLPHVSRIMTLYDRFRKNNCRTIFMLNEFGTCLSCQFPSLHRIAL